MPQVDTPNASPYPTIGTVMNLARVRVNDTAIDLAGELLADDQPYTETLLNAGWSWLKEKCAISGIERPIRTADIFGVPMAPSSTGIRRSWINWFGCWDGYEQYESPALPSDLYLPLKVSRRQSDANVPFLEMRQAENGLPSTYDPNVYDWSDDGMYFYAPSFAQDFQIRYSADLPTLILANTNDPIPFLGCERALAARIAYEFANTRGASQAPAMQQLAEDEFEMIAQRTGRKNQRRNLRRQPYARASRHSGY